jgi:hypothetical protein
MRVQWRHRIAGEPDHELIWFAVSAASIAGAAIWLALALPWPFCIFHKLTGLPCLTCGSTRSMIAIFHGNLFTALRWNPLAFFAFLGVILFDVYAVVVLVGRTARLRLVDCGALEKNAVRIAVLALLLLNWAYLLAHRSRF